MANITIQVQSLLNTAVYDSYTIDNGQTVAQLKTAINSARSFNSTWYDLVLNGVLSEASTLASLGIITGTQLRTHNKISRLSTLQLRQTAKLNLAALDRAASSNARSTYDITELPTQYSGNDLVNNNNTGGLIEGRPWISGGSPPAGATYTASPSTLVVNEGTTLTYNITTTNVADGTTLYWTNAGTTVAADFNDNANSGSFTVNTNAGTVIRQVKADNFTEGSETVVFNIRTGSVSGTIVETASTVTVNDTSLTPTFYEALVSGGAPLTYSAGFNGQLIELVSTNLNGTSTSGSYIKVNGTIIASDSSIGTGTTMTRGHTMAVINPSDGSTISIATYDTFGVVADSTAFAAALAAVTTGRIVAVATYDATSLTVAVRNALTNNYNDTTTGTWTPIRRSHIFVGVKN